MKILKYKGIEFDDYQLYKDSGNRKYGYPSDENINLNDYDEVSVYICPHCIKKYNLYNEADENIETVEKYINGEYDDGTHSLTCGVKSCYNGNSFDTYFCIDKCELE